jgi:hypothetical protein
MEPKFMIMKALKILFKNYYTNLFTQQEEATIQNIETMLENIPTIIIE